MKNLQQQTSPNMAVNTKTESSPSLAKSPANNNLPECSERCRVMMRDQSDLKSKHILELQDRRRLVMATLRQIDIDMKHLGYNPDELMTFLEWITKENSRGFMTVHSDHLDKIRLENEVLKQEVSDRDAELANLKERFKKQLHLDKMNENGRVVVDEVILKKKRVKGAVTGKTAYRYTKAVKKAAKKKK